MGLRIEVNRDVLFAPTRHVTSWALNPVYASAQGNEMLMSVSETDGHGLGAQRYVEWTRTWRRFRSLDGGETWQPAGETLLHPSAACYQKVHTGYEGLWAYWLDPQSGHLVGLHSTPDYSSDFRESYSRFYYTVSVDRGLSWDASRQIVHSGDNCDSRRWMPGFDIERHAAQFDQPHPVTLDDGTLVFGFTVKTPRCATRFSGAGGTKPVRPWSGKQVTASPSRNTFPPLVRANQTWCHWANNVCSRRCALRACLPRRFRQRGSVPCRKTGVSPGTGRSL